MKPIINSVLRFAACYLLVGIAQVANGQIVADLSVSVEEEDGLYTYTYTAENSFFSFQSLNTFLLTTGKGAVVTEISGPNGWAAEYDGVGLPSFQAGFIAGDGEVCGDGEPGEIGPGLSGSFTIESTWAPELQDFNLGRLITDPVFGCDWQGDPIAGTILSPSIAPAMEFEPCDFDEDGDCDLQDINSLATVIFLEDHEPPFDLTNDDLVNLDDLGVFLDVTDRINGDADFNGRVEFADFLQLSGNFGSDNALWSEGDFNADGSVAFADFLILSGNFGMGEIAAQQSVPEPQSATFASLALLFATFWRRRRS